MLFIELGPVNLPNLCFDFFIPLLNDFILDISHLLLRPLIHLHLCLPKTVWLSLFVQIEGLEQSLQIVKHQLIEA